MRVKRPGVSFSDVAHYINTKYIQNTSTTNSVRQIECRSSSRIRQDGLLFGSATDRINSLEEWMGIADSKHT